MSIYFYYGDEDYLIEKEINKLRKKLDINFKDMNYKKHENLDFVDFITVLRTIPMMFGNMLIVINVNNYISKSLDKPQIQELKSALDSNTEGVDIVLTCINEKNTQKSYSPKNEIFKLFTEYNSCEFNSIKTYKTAELSSIIKQIAKEKKVTLTTDAINALIEQIGNNLREFDLELEKLSVCIHPKKEITLSDVKEFCITNEDFFNMTEYLLKENKGKALIEFRKLTDKTHPLAILSTLQTMLRKWILIKLKSKNYSAAEVSKIVGLHEFVVKQTLTKLKNTPLKNLVELKQNLCNTEYKIKSAQSLSIQEDIENAILS